MDHFQVVRTSSPPGTRPIGYQGHLEEPRYRLPRSLPLTLERECLSSLLIRSLAITMTDVTTSYRSTSKSMPQREFCQPLITSSRTPRARRSLMSSSPTMSSLRGERWRNSSNRVWSNRSVFQTSTFTVSRNCSKTQRSSQSPVSFFVLSS